MAPLDLTDVLRGYEGKWVVLTRDYRTVIASGKTPKSIANAMEKGIVMLVPHPDFAYVPIALPV